MRQGMMDLALALKVMSSSGSAATSGYFLLWRHGLGSSTHRYSVAPDSWLLYTPSQSTCVQPL